MKLMDEVFFEQNLKKCRYEYEEQCLHNIDSKVEVTQSTKCLETNKNIKAGIYTQTSITGDNLGVCIKKGKTNYVVHVEYLKKHSPSPLVKKIIKMVDDISKLSSTEKHNIAKYISDVNYLCCYKKDMDRVIDMYNNELKLLDKLAIEYNSFEEISKKMITSYKVAKKNKSNLEIKTKYGVDIIKFKKRIDLVLGTFSENFMVALLSDHIDIVHINAFKEEVVKLFDLRQAMESLRLGIKDRSNNNKYRKTNKVNKSAGLHKNEYTIFIQSSEKEFYKKY